MSASRYGWLPRETYESFQAMLDEHEDLFFIPTTVETHRVYGIYFTTREGHEKVDSLFASLHFVRIRLDPAVHGTPQEAIDELTAQAGQAEEALRALREEKAAFAAKEGERLRAVCSWLRYHSELAGLAGMPPAPKRPSISQAGSRRTVWRRPWAVWPHSPSAPAWWTSPTNIPFRSNRPPS